MLLKWNNKIKCNQSNQYFLEADYENLKFYSKFTESYFQISPTFIDICIEYHNERRVNAKYRQQRFTSPSYKHKQIIAKARKILIFTALEKFKWLSQLEHSLVDKFFRLLQENKSYQNSEHI